MTPVQQFEQLWKSSGVPPDVFGYLCEHNIAESDLWLALLRIDQQYHWQTDQPVKVEDYLKKLSGLDTLPSGPAGIDWKLQLAIGEFDARRNTCRPLNADEISCRFPDLSDSLRERLRAQIPDDQVIANPGHSVADLLTTSIKTPNGKMSAVTYITGNAIGGHQKGRYRLDRVLGEGSFGRVYLGFDEELLRQVAIKVPTKARFQRREDADDYLAEARVVASLDHPNIVPVYDMGRTDDGSIYVVTKFIEGGTLAGRIKAGRFAEKDSAQLLATIALALQHAHQKRLIHRDIKPANILIEDKTQTPYVADFGLAIREEDYREQNDIAGTPAYMSPEQIRGEGHRLDGRSDIFSMGVILYELLTGSKPFRGSSILETMHLVVTQEPRPPRELLETIPAELERICLKALSKRASDRYATVAEFADDLLQWLKPTSTVAQPKTVVQVVPRGLRSFDANDADFFLDLLPGPRNRDGLPESIAFWKQRIEQTDPEHTFSVGLIYGPSGCGKSSLVKAGLLPHLSIGVIAVYVEATPEDTETRILRGLRKRLPELSEDLGLTDTLASLRRGQDDVKKVVIIIDQFEQWLLVHRAEPEAELVKALRQCDGRRLQSIVMVRDDFAMGAARLMNALDVPILQGENFATVDLFEVEHAAKVLTRFGQAFGKLPANAGNLSAHERQFVNDVSRGLAQDGKIVSVRLSLFADMVKSKPWTAATLQQVGGTQGIGVNFLEETFGSRDANPRHRPHAVAARGVLRSLLPELHTDIKGGMRSHADLLAASGYQDRPADFNDLLRILDGELRLITPTDPDGDSLSGSSRDSSLATRYYQLTHDYLVPSLREWLTRKQKETRKGRAELKLEERAVLWTIKPENRYLPSLREWIGIRGLTETNKWTECQRRMMQKAGRMHMLRTGSIVAILLAASLTLQFILAGQKAASLVEALKTASPEQLTTLIQQADKSHRWVDRLLQPLIEKANAADAAPADREAALPARLVLAGRDSSQIKPLSDALLSGDLANVEPIRTRLRQYASELRPQWLEVLRNTQEPATRRFWAALGLAGLDGHQSQTEWSEADLRFIAEQMTSSFAEYQPQLRNLLRPIGGQLVPSLDTLFDAETATEDQQINATMAIADYAGDDAELMAQLLTRATARQAEILNPKVAEFKSGPVRDGLLALTKEQPDENLGQLDRVRLGRRRANAAITLLRQGEYDAYFDALRITDDPESISQFVARCQKWGVTSTELIESLHRSAALCQSVSGVARKIESRVMYGLLLALGTYPVEQIPEDSREALIVRLLELYGKDPSAPVHSASGWLLRYWGRSADVQKMDEQEVPYDPTGEREWFRLRLELTKESSGLGDLQGLTTKKHSYSLTFIVFPMGEYRLGSPEFEGGELDRQNNEVPRVVRISRPVALCDRELTWGLYDLFDAGQWRSEMQSKWGWDLSDDDAVFGRNWYEWVEFCRRLTVEWHGDDQSWQCYPDTESLEKDGNGNPVYGKLLLDHGGFRMPTDSEWELAARSGQRTAYGFGSDVSLLGDYGWFVDNSEKRPHVTAVKPPSIGGFFDAHGNLFEWTHDWDATIDGSSLLVDPQGASKGLNRVLRGGGWSRVAAGCRLASRGTSEPTAPNASFGFRLALSLPSGINLPEAGGTK